MRKRAFRKWVRDGQGRQYEVVSDAELPDNIEDILQAFFSRVSDLRNLFMKTGRWGNTLVRKSHYDLRRDELRRKLHEKLKSSARSSLTSLKADGDKLIPTSASLRGEEERALRLKENDLAIGGMRNPRLSIGTAPGHKSLGPRINNIITLFLAERPHVMETY